MCGRYTLSSGENPFKRFKIDIRSGRLRPSFNIPPGKFMPVIISQNPNYLAIMKWGLIPSWAKDIRIGNKMINTKAETLKDKPAFRTSFQSKRCLVPASGFYEWKLIGNKKIPYFFRLKDSDLFAFAGLYDVWKDAEGKEIWSYTIITCISNNLVGKTHERMPVILKKEDDDKWLDKNEKDPNKLLELLNPYESEKMESYQVSDLVNDPKNDKSSLIKPI